MSILLNGVQIMLLFSRCLMVTIALFADMLFATPVSAQKMTLAEVITNVESNEQLYRNIEVICTEVYQLAEDAEIYRDNLITNRIEQTRSVTQSNYFFLKVSDSHNLANNKTFELSGLYGYDGEVTRHVNSGNDKSSTHDKSVPIVNINNKKMNPCKLFVAHTWLVSNTISPCVTPLSVLLRGGKEFQNYPGNGRNKNTQFKTSLEREENIDGLRCVKLRLESSDIQGDKLVPNGLGFLWLAIDRNYLPVQQHGYVPWVSTEITLGENTAMDFRQIVPDIWLPFYKKSIAYDHIALKNDKSKKVIRNRSHGTIELAKLDPKYDISFFRDIEFPARAVVYELKKNQIVDSYIQPGEVPSGVLARSRWWMVAAAAVLCVTLLIVWRRVRNVRRSATTPA